MRNPHSLHFIKPFFVLHFKNTSFTILYFNPAVPNHWSGAHFWPFNVSSVLTFPSFSSHGPALLPSALRLWARERRRAGLQRGRCCHFDQSDRWQLVRGHDPRPVWLLPHQLCGNPGSLTSLGPDWNTACVGITDKPHPFFYVVSSSTSPVLLCISSMTTWTETKEEVGVGDEAGEEWVMVGSHEDQTLETTGVCVRACTVCVSVRVSKRF